MGLGVQEIDLADQVGSLGQEVETIQEEHHMEGNLDQEVHNQEDRNVADHREDSRSLGTEVVEDNREVDQVGRLDREDREALGALKDLEEVVVAVGELEDQGGACSNTFISLKPHHLEEAKARK